LSNRIALGSAQFGLDYGICNYAGRVPLYEVEKILRIGSLNGIDTIDTAISYADSQKVLGQAGVKKYKIISKLPPIPSACDDILMWARGQVKQSLLNLGQEKLYGLLLHDTSQLCGDYGAKLFHVLQQLKIDGLVDKIGVSIYSPNELELLIPEYPLEIVQSPFNLLDRRIFSSGWLYKLKSFNIEIHARSIFLQGLLLADRGSIPLKFAKWSILWDVWHEWLRKNNFNATQACLNYALSFPEIDRIIVGVDNTFQLNDILNSEYLPRIVNFPDLQCDDGFLINPTNWSKR